jgi:hypothetical protein
MEALKPAVKGAVTKPAKPSSPHVPRVAAVLAIVALLAVPIVVPIAVMKATGKSGRRWVSVADAIEGPPAITAAPNEEVTPEEVKEAFLKVTNKKV